MGAGGKKSFDPDAAQSMRAEEIAAYLDERQRRFAKEFDIDLNGTQAAIRAGYAPGQGNASAARKAYQLLRDPRIKAYRAALLRESMEDMTLTKDAVALKLLEIYQRCMAEKPVMQYDRASKEWVPSGEWQFDARGAMKVLEQLSKMLGFDAPSKHDGGAICLTLAPEDAANGE